MAATLLAAWASSRDGFWRAGRWMLALMTAIAAILGASAILDFAGKRQSESVVSIALDVGTLLMVALIALLNRPAARLVAEALTVPFTALSLSLGSHTAWSTVVWVWFIGFVVVIVLGWPSWVIGGKRIVDLEALHSLWPDPPIP